MGDMGVIFNDMREHRRELRRRFGILCPECPKHRPRAHPTILMPGQCCKVDGYRDDRPPLTDAERGIVRVS